MSVKPKQTAVQYQSRGNRCEGVYENLVSSRINLRIVGYHLNAPNLGGPAYPAVTLRAASVKFGGAKAIKIISLRASDFYQMDTTRVGANGDFVWPLDIVRELKPTLRAFHLAGIACATSCEPRSDDDLVLLPLNFLPQTGPQPAVRPKLLVMADVALAEVRVRFDGVEGGGRETVVAMKLPQQEAVPIFVPGAAGQTATVTITALTAGGQQDRVKAQLVLPGASR